MKASKPINYRVAVYPQTKAYGFSLGIDEKKACEDIMNDVKRHVDDLGYVEIEFDTEHTCSHCDSTWTEDSETFNGGCCAKDMENEPQTESGK